MTFDPANDFLPFWSPDDSQVFFSSDRSDAGDIFQKPASGVGADQLFLHFPGFTVGQDYSLDGRYIAFMNIDPDGKRGWDLWVYSVAEKKVIPFLQTPFNELNPKFSPNGKWIAYQSDESGKPQIYVQPFPPNGGKWQISTDGGTRPRWAHSGKELFFIGPDNKTLMAAQVQIGTTLTAGAVTPLLAMNPKYGPDVRFSVAPDDQRFIVNNAITNELKAPVTLVQNWLALHR